MEKMKIISIHILVIILIISCKSRYQETIENTSINKDFNIDSIANYNKDQEQRKKLYINLKNTEFILEYFDIDNYQDNVNGIRSIIQLFKKCDDLVIEGSNSNIDSIKRRAELLSKKKSDIRVVVWPKLRDKFGQVLAKEMWVYDMYISTKGARNTTIEFISLDYSLNKNIKKTQDDLRSIFYDLRFKKVIYKTSKYDEEYTFYDLSSKNDSD